MSVYVSAGLMSLRSMATRPALPSTEVTHDHNMYQPGESFMDRTKQGCLNSARYIWAAASRSRQFILVCEVRALTLGLGSSNSGHECVWVPNDADPETWQQSQCLFGSLDGDRHWRTAIMDQGIRLQSVISLH
jgi:hypothetical protein